MNELASIIIPVYNYGNFLAEAIDSALKQSYGPVEVIVVDDGSTDDTANIARSCKDVQYYYQTKQGVAVARNTGISKARGKYISFLDADDTWLTDKLKIQINHLHENPGMGYNICHIRNFAEPGVNLDPVIVRSLQDKEQVGFATIVTTKSVFDQVGGFDPRFIVGEDFNWFARAKDAGILFSIIPDVLVNRRIHNSNLSIYRPQLSHVNRLRTMKESIERMQKKKAGTDGGK